MEQVDISAKSIEETTGFVHQTGTALKEIVGMVDSAAVQAHVIATAAEQQSSANEETNQSITDIDVIVAETAQAMHTAARFVSDFTSQVHVLAGLIAAMKQR